jgi:signal transduction histidine kinase/ligand-binding sensor domain-containing protein/CheY-like chemotaxis protein/AraC-like DNA-binding protein
MIYLNSALRWIVALFPIWVGSACYAQSHETAFVSVAPEQLSGTFVRCIIKDSRGFMWFGTGSGLIRYDGTNVYRYEHEQSDNKSISDNRINTFFEDDNHNLWIGTGQGLMVYDRDKDNFINVDSISDNVNHLNNQYITSLSMDHQGKMWIGTHGHGISIYNPKTHAFTYLSPPEPANRILSPDHYVTTLFLNGETMWAGTKGGLRLFNTAELHSLLLPFEDESITAKEITQIVDDPKGNIWLTTVDKEILKLHKEQNRYQIVYRRKLDRNIYGEGGDNILTLSVDANDNLWIGGENSGLNYLDVKSNTIIHYAAEEGNPKALPANSIRSVYVDDTGITWIGTYFKGAYMIDNRAKKFETYQHNLYTKTGLPGNNVKGFAEDQRGNIWIACDGGGLGKIDSRNHVLQSCESINVRLGTRYLSSVFTDVDDNLWIGTWGKGVYKLNLETNELKNYKIESNGFGDNKVFKIYQDRQKKIWVASVGSGLFYFDVGTNKFLLLNEEHKLNHISRTAYVTSLIEDSNHNLWVSTLFGLFRLTPTQLNSYDFKWFNRGDRPDGIGSNEIQTIHEDKNKKLWFGTGDNGMVLLNKKSLRFKVIKKQDGLLSNNVKGILTDSNNNMWISGNMGLSNYNPIKNTFRNYTKDNGLPSNEFNASACLQASDGKFYFGSDNGLLTFYPDSIQINPVKPIVYLTDFKLNNQSVQIDAVDSPLKKHISLTDAIDLQFDQHSFAIDFAAISYGEASRSQYCYMLKGFDDDWNCVGSNHEATYTNIDPGHYTFLAKAYNIDGIESEVPAKLEITIYPARWKTWWAITLYILVSLSFIWFLAKVRMERIKIKNQLEFERLAREKEHALNESKTDFFTNISHELRTPLSLIAMPLENLDSIDELPLPVKERITTIRASADKMMRLVNELMDFNKLEGAKMELRVQHGDLVKFIRDRASVFNDLAAKGNIHFGIHSMLRSLHGWFDQDKLEKVLVNVLSNAFKFTSDNGQINITINAKETVIGRERSKIRNLELVIVDNGIGISPQELPFIFDKFYQAKSSTKVSNPGTGIGLSLTKGLIELHHGHIDVKSDPDHGTRFTIHIPIDRQSFRDDEICEDPGYIVTPEAAVEHEAIASSDNDLIEEDHDQAQILIVEDNDELRKYIALEFKHEFKILEAKDGKEGWEMAAEKSPDLIISDILMPVKTGIELCREIKSNVKTSHIPFILLTAKTTVEDQITGVASGADVYITKPFSIRFLLAQVNQIIESRKKLYSRFSQDVYLLPGKIAGNEIDQAFLQKAIDYIVENIQDPQLGVDSIADLFNLSRMQIYRKIKALTGNSVVDFIRMVRIKQALTLMGTKKYTLSEIAYQTGFNSSSYFTKCFKDQYGKTPSEYLESNA